MKKIRILFLIYRYWLLLTKCSIIIKDGKSLEGELLSRDLTEEELEGCYDLEVLHRFFSQSPDILNKDLKHLAKVILKK